MSRKRKITDEEWGNHREEIKDLYLAQHMPLKDVMEWMKENRNFAASKNQYTRQFAKWGFKKYLTGGRWVTIARKLHQRNLRRSKSPVVVIYGDQVPIRTVRKEIARHVPLSFFCQLDKAEEPQTPEGVSIFTPRAENHEVFVGLQNLPWFRFQDFIFSRFISVGHDRPSPIDELSLGVSPTSPSWQIQPANEPNRDVCMLPTLHDLDSRISQQVDNEDSSPNGLARNSSVSLNSEMSDQDVCSNLVKILSLKIKPGDAGYAQDIISYLEPITLERTDGQLARDIENLLVPHSPETLVKLLSYSVYLVSNNLLSDLQIKNLYNWMMQNRHHRILDILADIDSPTTRTFLANILSCATAVEDIDVVRVMVFCKGVDVNSAGGSESCRTPIQEAVITRNIQLVDLLLHAGADPNRSIEGIGRDLPLHRAVIGENNYRLTELLLDAGANPNSEVDDELGWVETPLHLAAQHSQLEVARLLLDNGADVNLLDNPKSGTALQAAVGNCDIDMVQLLLGKNADVNVPTLDTWEVQELSPWFQSPIHTAVVRNNLELVQILLGANADANLCPYTRLLKCRESDLFKYWDIEDEDRWTPLQVAVINRNHQLVQLLLNTGAAVEDRGADQYGRTPLQMASEAGDVDLVRMLLQHHADINGEPGYPFGRTALQAAAENEHVELVKVLIDSGADVNACSADEFGITALQAGISTSNVDLVKLLLEDGADANFPNNTGESPLLTAIECENVDVVKLLIGKGANTISRARALCRALYQEWRAGKEEIFELLIDAGIDVNALIADVSGRNALQLTAENRHIPAVQRLRSHVNAVACPPQTSSILFPATTELQYAVWNKDKRLVRQLVDAGADVNAPACSVLGRTALQKAAECGTIDLVQYLLDKGADVNAPAANDGGITALQGAAIGGFIRIVLILLERGADVNAAPARYNGRSALEGAAEHGRLDILQLLLDAHGQTDGQETKCERAADLATRNGHPVIAKFLRDYVKS